MFSKIIAFGKKCWQSLWRFIALLIIIVIAVWWYWVDQVHSPSTYDASLEAQMIPIVSQANGVIDQITAKPGQYVKKGSVLFTLNSDEEKLALSKAQLQLQKAKADQKNAQALVVQDKQKLDQAQNELTSEASNFKRYKKLYKQQAVSQSTYESQKLKYENAQKAVEIAMAQEKQDAIAANMIGVQSAENAVKTAQLNLSYTTIKAPIDGFLTFFHLHKGQYIQAGQALFGQSDGSGFYVQANILEPFLKHIRVGQNVQIELRVYPGLKLKGEVEVIGYAISQGSSQLGVEPTVDPTFDWIHVAKRFPVYIKVTSSHDFNKTPFYIGSSAWVKIDTSSAH